MLSLPPSVRIYVCVAAADMRKGFDGLAALAREVIAEDPLSGHLFVFRNRQADRIKVLYWDRDGYAIWQKRLERGSFAFPASKAKRMELTSVQLHMILQGMDLAKVQQCRRFSWPQGVDSK